MSKFKIAIYLLFFIVTEHAYAESMVIPSLAPPKVLIGNKVNQPVSFSLTPAGGRASAFSLESGVSGDYECIYCSITIKTGEQVVSKNLDPKGRYEIFLNPSRVLDVRPMSPR